MTKFILCSDLHFTDHQPKCRTDDFMKAQIEKMKWLKQLTVLHNAIVLCAGDVFDVAKPNPEIISLAIEHLPFIYTIPGQHDLPRHSLDLIFKSGLTTLEKAGNVQLVNENAILISQRFMVTGFPFGTELIKPPATQTRFKSIALIHKLIDHPQSSETAERVCKQLKGFDLIVSGDNHKTFIYLDKKNKTLLVNPGGFSRQKADEAHHRPCVFLWDSSNPLEVEQVFIPIRRRVISRSHLKRQKQQEEIKNKFAEKLDQDYKIGMSYEDNLKAHIEKNNPSKQVQEMAWESIELSKKEK
jgi:DNA repair exonuclease SbcCD nuclease subunit